MIIYCVEGNSLVCVCGGGGGGGFGERKTPGGEHGGTAKHVPCKETAGYTGKTCKTP